MRSLPHTGLVVGIAGLVVGIAGLLALGVKASVLPSQPQGAEGAVRANPDDKTLEVPKLMARTLHVYEAPEADQGVAADARHFYAVDNTVIAKYEVASGKQVDRWLIRDATW